MKILFNNTVWDSTFSALHANTNYPLTNLNHQFLELPFMSMADNDVITITFPAAQTIDCVYVGFTNAAAIDVELYNNSGILITTKELSMSKLGGVFVPVAGVRSLKVIAATTGDPLYLGTVAAGLSSSVGTMINGIVKGKVDNSTTTSSARGQTLKNKVAWLKKVPVQLFCKGVDEWNAVYALFADNRRPVFVDVYESLDNAINPFYANVELEPGQQSWKVYKYNVIATEAR